MKRIAALLIVALVALVGCSSGSGNDSGRDAGSAGEQPPFELNGAPVATNEVTAVKSYKFDPQVISVSPGSEVTWVNEDDFPHNIHLLDASDATHDLPIGDSVSITFDESGEHYYECSIHPQQMRGKVVVTNDV